MSILRIWLMLALVTLYGLILGGCSQGQIQNPNSPLVFSNDTRDQIHSILIKSGVEGEILSVQDRGDYWDVSLKPNQSTLVIKPSQVVTMPPLYKVYKNGKVIDPAKSNR